VLNSDSSNLRFEVIIVDNGSSDQSWSFIKDIVNSNPNVKAIRNLTNAGPSIARNQAIKISLGKYVAFLDNDTRVHPAWLNNAVRTFEFDPKIGACQCKLLLDNAENRIDCIGEYMSQYGFLVQLVNPGDADNEKYNKVVEILSAKSAGMIVRKDVLDKVGGFDEDFFIYMEETDLCWRIWLQGYVVVLIPNSIVYHKFGTSSAILPQKINYLVKFHGTKNYVCTLIKNLDFKNLFEILPLHIIMWFGIATVFLFKKQFKSTKWIILGILWNFANYKKLINKRRAVQQKRVVKDKDLYPKIMRRKNFWYFVRKLETKKKTGNASGWDKDE